MKRPCGREETRLFLGLDENGLIRYQGEPMVYHLTVLNVPEGYDFTPPEELVTEDHPCAMTLVFTKETLTE